MPKKRICYAVVTLITAAAMCALLILPGLKSLASTPGISGGNGSAENPYVIVSAEGLREVENHPEASFLLDKDIDLGGDVWSPLCSESMPFTGNFNGNFHTVSGLTLKSSGNTDGLFAAVGEPGTVKNLGIAAATIKSKANNIGSITGLNYGTVLRCYNNAAVACSNSDACVGGIVGSNYGSVSNCYNKGAVSSKGLSNIGGISGINKSELLCCYNTGKLSGTNRMGGIVGLGATKLCHFAVQSKLYDTGDGSGTQSGESASLLKKEDSYEGWDFTNVWAIDSSINGGYPYLRIASDDNRLKSLSITPGSLSPAFEGSNLFYNAVVPSDTESIKVDAQAENSSAKVICNGKSIDENLPINIGENTLEVTVTAENGAKRVYTVMVTRSVPANANLASLEILSVNLTPQFDKNTFSYNGEASAETENVRVKAVAEDETSVVMVNGNDNTTVALQNGENKIEISVTAEDGTENIYTVYITRQKASNTYLSSLSVSGASLSPDFDKETDYYEAFVESETASVNINVVSEDGSAAVLINGNDDGKVELNVGSNQVKISVIAQDGSERIYTVNITRKKSSENRLSSLEVGGATLSPIFESGTEEYSCSVENTQTSATITAEAKDKNASVLYNGTANNTVALNVGSNQVKISVIAQDGSERIYTVNIIRKKSSESHLSSLAVEGSEFSYPFENTVLKYNCTVASSKDFITVNATTKDKNAALLFNGSESNIINLSKGQNQVDITVIAEDGSKSIYTIYITREYSDENRLAALEVSGASLSPSFGSDLLQYNCSVDYNIDKAVISAVCKDESATVKYNGQSSNTVPLSYGQNNIKVTVTAENGVSKNYYITVTRLLSDNCRLSRLSVNEGRISPDFSPAITDYEITVDPETTELSIDAEAEDEYAEVTINGKRENKITLSPGSNTISVKVMAMSGKTLVYNIKVNRLSQSHLSLNSLSLKGADISPSFSPQCHDYTAVVPFNVTSVKLNAEAFDATSNISFDTADGSATKALAVGENTVKITVRDNNGKDDIYTLKVVRQEISKPLLSALSFESGELSPSFSPNSHEYTLTVSPQNSVKLTPTVYDKDTQIFVDGELCESGKAFVSDGLYDGRKISINLVAADGGSVTYIVKLKIKEEVSADLSGLSVNVGSLSPQFSPDVTDYTVNLSAFYQSIKIIPMCANDKESIKINASAVNSGKTYCFDLVSGQNKIYVAVSAGNITKVYNITVNNGSAPQLSGLKSLMLSMGALSPSFSALVLNYSLTVENDVSTVAVIADAVNDSASITVNASSSKTVSLTPGKNTVTITVTEANGKLTVYTVNVYRKFKQSQSISYTDSSGNYKSEIPDSATKGVSGDGYTLKLGDDKITFDEGILKELKGNSPLEVSLLRLNKSKLSSEIAKLASDRSVICGLDILVSGGSCDENSKVNAVVEAELTSEFKNASKYGVPCVYYCDGKTGSLKRIYADFQLSSGLVSFCAEKSGRYIFAVILTEPKVECTLTADKNYTVSASGKSFECFVRRSVDSLIADDLSLVVNTTLLNGQSDVKVYKLSGDDEDFNIQVSADAFKSEAYVIEGNYGDGNAVILGKSHLIS